MATGIEVLFRSVQIGEDFEDDDGVEYEKRSAQRGEVMRGHGYREDGEFVYFAEDAEVKLLT